MSFYLQIKTQLVTFAINLKNLLMKRVYTFLVAAFLIVSANMAQKRLVLIEEFTNTGCGPCASWSPVLDSCINYRLGDCIAIKYHSAFPNKEDEFYLNEKEAQQSRVDYYDIHAVPTTLVDGQELGDRSFGYMDQAITYCQQQPAHVHQYVFYFMFQVLTLILNLNGTADLADLSD